MADQRSPSAPHDRELYTIPSCSSWFQWDGIHETERRELGEFFDGSSFSRNPRVYKEYRDFLIARYREDPSRRLTFTEARRSLVGDVAALHRVYLFLDRWGLVNFSAAERTREDEGGPGVFPVVAEDGPPASIKVVRFPNAAKGVPPPPSGSKAGEEGVGSLRLPPLTSYSDVFGQRTPLAGRVCGDCGEVCASGYHESKSGIVICTECFKSENLSTINLSDVYKFNDKKIDGEKQLTNEWTDTETLFLLEAIVSKGPDWDLIANHVRRNRLDCIAKFIQLPFGEHMLGSISGKYDQRNSVSQRAEESMQATPDIVQEFVKADIQDIENSVEKGHAAEESKIEPPLKRRRSFADASDSLMEKVASLSSLAGPHVAAAAAGAAISALCDEHPYGKKVFMIDDNEANGTDFSFVLKEKPSSDLKAEDGKTDEASNVAESATGENFGHLAFEIRAATATAFGAAAAHAKLLADQEDRQIEYLMASIIDMQLRKLEYKMKHFDELESIMEQHYTQIQQLKEDILREWIDVSQRALAAGIPKWKDHGFQKSILIKSTSIT
uniref:SWI/SNF complex subunit SWI3A n=1 Tax=Anthurium amnicola TaxID=1678845 RepID=A0A1D1XME5_9ARAE